MTPKRPRDPNQLAKSIIDIATGQKPVIPTSVRAARGMTEKVLAASPNPQWTEYELQTIDEWIARQCVKLDRSEAIRRLVELGLKMKSKS